MHGVDVLDKRPGLSFGKGPALSLVVADEIRSFFFLTRLLLLHPYRFLVYGTLT